MRKNSRKAFAGRVAHLVMVLTLAVALGGGVTGCGKKGAPMPDYSSRLFSWRNVFATLSSDGCLSVSGSVSGAFQNMTGMALELQPLDTSCEGCPFVPQEAHRVTASDAWESPNGSTFRFAYCPAVNASAYRWRLAGRNVFSGLPPVLTPVRVVDAMTTSGPVSDPEPAP